jgi:AbrB family looped-hinge helix DNA binding protein
MSITMRVTEKGQVTIPQSIREKMGIRCRSEVEFSLEGERAYIQAHVEPVAVAEKLTRYRGSADAGMGTDEILALTRA